MNFIWPEDVNSDVKFKRLYLQSNQNDFAHFVDVLVQSSKISKSVWSKVVKDRFKQFDQTEFQNIENWTSSLS